MKKYKQYFGPRTYQRRLRRRWKATIMPVIILALVLISAPVQSRMPDVEATPTPLWARPTKSNIAVARNYYALNGENGDSRSYMETWPEFMAYITGEKNIEDLIELPDGTVMLPPEDGEVLG